jgi:hypothetical protein
MQSRGGSPPQAVVRRPHPHRRASTPLRRYAYSIPIPPASLHSPCNSNRSSHDLFHPDLVDSPLPYSGPRPPLSHASVSARPPLRLGQHVSREDKWGACAYSVLFEHVCTPVPVEFPRAVCELEHASPPELEEFHREPGQHRSLSTHC